MTYRKYGRSNRCRNGKGGPWANDVYIISGKADVCEAEHPGTSSYPHFKYWKKRKSMKHSVENCVYQLCGLNSN